MVTRDQVEVAYTVLLRRLPESEDVIRHHMIAADINELLRNIMSAPEFAFKSVAADAIHNVPFINFTHIHTVRMTARRQEHLTSLGLPLHNRKVLEIGSGIGMHAHYFLDRNCEVTTTDGRLSNVETARAVYEAYGWYEGTKKLRILPFDIESDDPKTLGRFEVVYCYGLLYHLANPEAAIVSLAELCSDLLLIETSVSYGDEEQLPGGQEDSANVSQSVHGYGTHPTRPWLFNRLRKSFEYVYIPKTQPNHELFPIDWERPKDYGNQTSRAVFIASRFELTNPSLLDKLPSMQSYAP